MLSPRDRRGQPTAEQVRAQQEADELRRQQRLREEEEWEARRRAWQGKILAEEVSPCAANLSSDCKSAVAPEEMATCKSTASAAASEGPQLYFPSIGNSDVPGILQQDHDWEVCVAGAARVRAR